MAKRSSYKRATSGICHYCDYHCRKWHYCSWYKRFVKKVLKGLRGRNKNVGG